MPEKLLPFTKKQIEKIIKKYPTPFHIYDEKAIRENARAFKKAFAWNDGFKEFFAVKAAPNPYLMKILHTGRIRRGLQFAGGIDDGCKKPALPAKKSCFHPTTHLPRIFCWPKRLQAIINLDDISHIDYLEKSAGLPSLICFRYNPGPLKKGNVIIGHPEEAKYGFTREQLFEGYRICRDKGIKRFGIHTMVASNELDAQYFVETAEILFQVDCSNFTCAENPV